MGDINSEFRLVISDHAYLRGKQRLGLKKSAVDRMARKAWCFGTPRDKCGKSLRTYLDQTAMEHADAEDRYKLHIYGHHIYVFRTRPEDGGIFCLTTILLVPNELRREIP